MSNLTRRQFLQTSAGLLGGLFASSLLPSDLLALASSMPMHTLGRTGAKVSFLGMGGFHVGIDSFTDETAAAFIHEALDNGITFLDNAREYNNGRSEERMGKALKGAYRAKAFLMTKNCAHDRTYEGSRKSLEDSLRALQTDYLDLWIMHEINYPDDPAAAWQRGAIEAALEARRQGKVRFIGFSGHKNPDFHLEMLKHPVDWDAVMIPLGIMDYHNEHMSFTRRVLPVLQGRNIGIIGFKTLGGFLSGVPQKIGIPVRDCLRYAMSYSPSTVLVGMESKAQLHENLDLFLHPQPLSHREKQSLIKKSAGFAGEPRMEIYKNTPDYDSSIGKALHGIK